MPHSPRVSIGLPVYNGENYLVEAVESVLGQTFDDLELIISDNASTDATAEICRSFAGRDARVRYERNAKNLGAAANYNAVFRLARGQLFKWAAHDDLLEPTFLERCVEAFDAAPPDVVLCFPRSAVIAADGEVIERLPENPRISFVEELDLRQPEPHQRLRHLISHMSMCHPVFGLIRSDALRRTRLIDRFHSSDVVLLTELALQGQFWELPERLFKRRLHPGISMWNKTPEEVAAWFDPVRPPRLVMRYSRLCVEQVRSVGRAPISAADKVRCWYVLLRYLLPRNRVTITRELWSALRAPFSNARPAQRQVGKPDYAKTG